MVLQINLARGSTNFIGFMNQVHYIDNQFDFNFQPISLRVMNNFMIWYTYSQLQKNQFHELYNLISHKTCSTLRSRGQHPSQNKIHKIAHSNYIGFVLLALMYNNLRPKKNRHCLLMALRYCNERPRKIQSKRLEASR